jgi:hypothetical protein
MIFRCISYAVLLVPPILIYNSNKQNLFFFLTYNSLSYSSKNDIEPRKERLLPNGRTYNILSGMRLTTTLIDKADPSTIRSGFFPLRQDPMTLSWLCSLDKEERSNWSHHFDTDTDLNLEHSSREAQDLYHWFIRSHQARKQQIFP